MAKNCLSGLFSIQSCWCRLTPIVDRSQLNQPLMHMHKEHIEKRLNQRGLVSDVVSSSYSLVPKLSLIQRLLHRTDRTLTWPSDLRPLHDETKAYLSKVREPFYKCWPSASANITNQWIRLARNEAMGPFPGFGRPSHVSTTDPTWMSRDGS